MFKLNILFYQLSKTKIHLDYYNLLMNEVAHLKSNV